MSDNKQFHSSVFDGGTQLKLELFRGYIRQWLPVFLSGKSYYSEVHVYDFFSGPGTDIAGNPGSPIVILEEIDAFFASRGGDVASNTRIIVHFNDINCDYITHLEALVNSRQKSSLYETQFSSQEFRYALFDSLGSIESINTANLIIIDQFGIKEVDKEIFCTLVGCKTTDILFFISSHFIKRFITEDSFKQYFSIPQDEVKSISQNDIHRYVCGYYKKMIPRDKLYYLAPFSIEKESNIYGLIFGSGNLLGLDKFLQVCWSKDNIAGEANYNIDEDICCKGQTALFPEDRVPRKKDKFKKELKQYISSHQPTNLLIYRFVLESGFLPTHAREVLLEFQKESRLVVTDAQTGQLCRKGSFYVSWDEYKTGKPRAQFSLEEE